MHKYFLLLIFSLLVLKPLLAETPPVVLEDSKEFYEIGLNLDILEDSSGKLTIDDVNSPEWVEKFKRSKDKVPNFGLSKSAFWAMVKVKNKTKDQRAWVISQNYVTEDNVTFLKKTDGNWESSLTTGDNILFKTREIHIKTLSFKIKSVENSLCFFRIMGAVNKFNLTIST